jgi:CelD/BcsL family acetyltransferase involved in cellulose biosynthesis
MPPLRRRNDERYLQPEGAPSSDTNTGLQQVRSETDRLLAAGDEAIRKALSGGNSEAFLRSAMQQGGQ